MLTASKTIQKYELQRVDRQTVKMPIGSTILTSQTQHGKPYMIVLADPNNSKEERLIETFNDDRKDYFDRGIDKVYRGSYQLNGSDFHVFEHIDMSNIIDLTSCIVKQFPKREKFVLSLSLNLDKNSILHILKHDYILINKERYKVPERILAECLQNRRFGEIHLDLEKII